MSETQVGVVQHFFDKIGVAAINMTAGKLAVGDTIHILGATTDITTTVESMQIEHEPVTSVAKKQEVAIKVKKRTRIHDEVYLLREAKK